MKSHYSVKNDTHADSDSAEGVAHAPLSTRRSEFKRARRIGGFVSTEVLVAIVVVALAAIYEGGRAYVMHQNGAQLNESSTINALADTISGAKVANSNGYGTGDLGAGMIQAKSYPSNLSVSGTSIMNQWNQPYTLTGAGFSFSISDSGLPGDACAATVKSEASNGRWDTMQVNGVTVDPTTLSTVTLAADCNLSANTLIFNSID